VRGPWRARSPNRQLDHQVRPREHKLSKEASATSLLSPRVLLVDDHDLFRTGLRTLLEGQGVDVVGEADAGTGALELIREVAPEVVVMDLNMPGIGGVEATRQIVMIAPLTRVLVLTISDQDEDVMDAILAGACGYLLKDAAIQELMAGIRAAAVGESIVSPVIASKLLQRLRATNSSPRDLEAIRSELSDREIQVLKLIANGKDNGQIAADLHISPKTVKNHISNILMKLQIENRIQAAVYAVRSGLV
jgi:DNA-binding NarL/FixJ family response regulator